MSTYTPVDNYNAFLLEHFHTGMLEEAFAEQNWFMKKCKVTKDWLQGVAKIQFKVQKASTISKNGLAAQADINSTGYLEATIAEPAKWSGALKFKDQDIKMHGKITEENLFNLIPDATEDLMDVFKQTFSLAIFGDGSLTYSTAAGSAAGIAVRNTERLGRGYLVEIEDGVDSVTGYIKTIDKNTGDIVLVAAMDLSGAALDCTALASGSRVWMTEKSATNEFFGLVDHLLPASLGGSDTLFGLTKTDYTALQSIIVDGSGVTGINILKRILGAMQKAQRLKAKTDTLICSYNTFGHIQNALQDASGAYKNVGDAMVYSGYSSISVSFLGQKMEIVAIPDASDDKILAINSKHLEFKSSPESYFEVCKTPEGLQFHTVRTDNDDYYYITDVRLQGQFVYTCVFDSFVIHSLDLPLLESETYS
jgi:hypothetical protein